MYGPVCTVVWQGSVGDRRPYANETQALYRKLLGARHSGYDLSQIAASLSIEAFEGSRWRLRRTRQQTVCGFNLVLVLKWDAAEDLDQGRKRHSKGCERVMGAF